MSNAASNLPYNSLPYLGYSCTNTTEIDQKILQKGQHRGRGKLASNNCNIMMKALERLLERRRIASNQNQIVS